MRAHKDSRPFTVRAVISAALVAGLSLPGCSAQQTPSAAPSADPSSAATNSTPAALGRTISYTLGDDRGYTVAVDLSFAPVKFSSSVVNAPPGKAVIQATAAVQGTITNTTSDRATTPLSGEGLEALFDLSSPACTQDLPRTKSVCILELGSIGSPQGKNASAALAPDASESLIWTPLPADFSVPEADASTWVKAFDAPLGYAIRQTTEWAIPDTCTVFVTGHGLGDGVNYVLARYPSTFSCT